MKISLNPLPVAMADAERRVNQHFNRLAMASIQQDQAHQRKRAAAEAAMRGGVMPDALVAEAEAAGVSVADLCESILAKPDELLARDLERRTLILRIRGAATPAEIAAVIEAAGIDVLPPGAFALPSES